LPTILHDAIDHLDGSLQGGCWEDGLHHCIIPQSIVNRYAASAQIIPRDQLGILRDEFDGRVDDVANAILQQVGCHLQRLVGANPDAHRNVVHLRRDDTTGWGTAKGGEAADAAKLGHGPHRVDGCKHGRCLLTKKKRRPSTN
jgi:hypothetical protein